MEAHLVVNVLVVISLFYFVYQIMIVPFAIRNDVLVGFIREDLSKKHLEGAGFAVHRNILFPINRIVISVLVSLGIRLNDLFVIFVFLSHTNQLLLTVNYKYILNTHRQWVRLCCFPLLLNRIDNFPRQILRVNIFVIFLTPGNPYFSYVFGI